ncbi:TetR/AcrR family transcriptional regulator [Flavobacterium sp.]|uniref:TetR/AcrR family transcriptional regulator n=1 Tax=Flavobacterium sp. TaxID=239 RepID=UPI0025E53A63|nr:TetR/AcrR family transcriptional regulator [Flavobacterium sp.]
MKTVLSNLKIQVNDKIYVKDPETSALGKRIIQESIILIDEIGFEDFTFRKLGERIGSNESSIYRYFDSKHKLMLYLSSWYWGWIEYKLLFATTNISSQTEKLNKAITVVTEKIVDDTETLHINEAILNKIIVAEFTKNLITKGVDAENKDGFFLVYKRVITRLVEIINEVNPEYSFAKSLASAVVEGALHQHFLKDHLKTITDCTSNDSVTEFYIDLIEKTLRK